MKLFLILQENDKELSELRKKYSELQLLHREKALELQTTSLLLASHADTYRGLQAQVSLFL